MGSLEAILALFRPDFVFSLAFIVGFWGFGYFFYTLFFPWFVKFMSDKQEYRAQQDKRIEAITDVLVEVKEELSALRTTHDVILAYLIADIAETPNEKDRNTKKTAALRALRRRVDRPKTAQQVLLQYIEGTVDDNPPEEGNK
jgi:hypothetical protein